MTAQPKNCLSSQIHRHQNNQIHRHQNQHLLWGNSKCDCPKVNLLVSLDAREDEKNSCKILLLNNIKPSILVSSELGWSLQGYFRFNIVAFLNERLLEMAIKRFCPVKVEIK